jgi:hypothetical protein
MRTVAVLVALLSAGVASADPSSAVMDSDGFVQVQMDVPHSQEAVLAYLSDAGRTMRLGEEITEVRTAEDGQCTRMKVTTYGFAQTMHFLARRCPIADGWRSTMLESPDFKRHDIEWTVAPTDAGSRVTMRVRIIPRLPVPQFIIRQIVGGALRSTLVRLESLLG